MAKLVFGVFEDKRAADEAIAELTRRTTEHPAFGVQSHTQAPLDGDDLPEAATETGRNTMIAMVVGSVAGLVIGVVGGATLDVMGMTPAIGAAAGLLTGALSGLLGGMMAGTRRPKAALREAAEGLSEGAILLTIEVGDSGHVDLVEEVLDRSGASFADSC
ncbi:hypothetical protein ENSA5_65400 [Enhygromyxa salina]|uniref:DUF1269 domain-containing protein n=1 Tax=Enhygromyxa salina TaxID=215803 RepID=A0A2S9XBV9_9BACT|nr:hypothetical protein [Enhygromyxa salina]PRP90343.1 hypothetical protein ENSA5_65400 [Enhygromyxa salina]